jgi:signal transduction histidine kinase
MVEMIIHEASDLGRMVEDLLTAARLDAGAMDYTYEDVPIQDEATEATGNVQRAGLDITISCEPAQIRVDQMRFRQILRNLLSNAGKYGGPHIFPNGRVDGHTYLVTVADDGPGMGPKVVERLFQRFTHHGSGTAVHQSVGLGLSIVQALVLGMGGSIHHERSERMTNFHVRLPLSAGHVNPRGIVEPADETPLRLMEA